METMKLTFTPIYVLDIETKPQADLVELYKDEIKPSKNIKDPEKIEKDLANRLKGLRKKMSIDPDSADIICVGIKNIAPFGDKEARLVEPKELEELFKSYFTLITYNGKKFDIPLLIKYGIKHDLDLPYKDLQEMTIKYRAGRHLDLQELICDNEYKSLDLLLQIYLGIKKTPIQFETATEEEIKLHCLEDVENEHKLYEKFKRLV